MAFQPSENKIPALSLQKPERQGGALSWVRSEKKARGLAHAFTTDKTGALPFSRSVRERISRTEREKDGAPAFVCGVVRFRFLLPLAPWAAFLGRFAACG